jgi:hypothetical protein
MGTGPSARAVIRLGVCVLFVAAVAGVWELLALQAPGSPLYLAALPGPVSALRELAMNLGLLLLAAGLLAPWAATRGEPKGLVLALHAGALLGLGAQLYCALTGMYGVQLYDLRPDAKAAFALKYGGLLLFGLSLLELGRRVLVRPPPPT